MQVKIAIPLTTIQAVALFRAEKDIRYYLQGIHLITGPCGARLCGCDGHTLGLANLPQDGLPPSNIILPWSLFQGLKDAKRNPSSVVIEYSAGSLPYAAGAAQPRVVVVTHGDTGRSGPEVDGMFPDYQRVIPSSVSLEMAYYNPEFLLRLVKAGRLLGWRNDIPSIGYNGTSSAVATIGNDFLAVIMPGRESVEFSGVPSWCSANLDAVDSAPELKSAA